MRKLCILIVILLFFVSFPVVSAGADETNVTIVVPDDYKTITLAIMAAKDWDTIYIEEGTYYENVETDKILTIEGDDRDKVIIDGGGNGDCLKIDSSHSKVINLTVTNGYCGIICGKDNWAGTVINCVAHNNTGTGITIGDGEVNDCIAVDNGGPGIGGGAGDILNCVSERNANGVTLSTGGMVKYSYLCNNNVGVGINNGGRISFCIISHNTADGVYGGGLITGSEITHNYNGINLTKDQGCSPSNNNIFDNTNYGICRPSSPDNIEIIAENNWWGDSLGPSCSDNAEGIGDNLCEEVDFVPWLDECYEMPETEDDDIDDDIDDDMGEEEEEDINATATDDDTGEEEEEEDSTYGGDDDTDDAPAFQLISLILISTFIMILRKRR